jgi:pilus assembly protein CpaF
MSLRDTILNNGRFQAKNNAVEDDFLQVEGSAALKMRNLLHDRLLKTIDLKAVDRMSEQELKPYLKTCIEKIIADDKIVIADENMARLVYEIQNEIMGLGPIEPLISDPTVSDILVNNYKISLTDT